MSRQTISHQNSFSIESEQGNEGEDLDLYEQMAAAKRIRFEVKDEKEKEELAVELGKLDEKQRQRGIHKFGEENRLLAAGQNINDLPKVVREFKKRDKILKNCVPVQFEKID